MKPRPEAIAGLFSEQKDAYTKFAPESFSWRYIERPALDYHLSGLLTPDSKVLDAGCGVGRSVKYLLKAGVDPSNILGLDLNPDMIAVSAREVPEANFLLADIEELPLRENSLDLILCTHVLHFLNNHKYRSTMEAFQRALKPGGILFMVIIHPVRAARNDLSHYFERRWVLDQNPWGLSSPLFFRTTGDLVNLALASGLILENLDELEVDPDGLAADPKEFQRYSNGPSRLALKFRK